MQTACEVPGSVGWIGLSDKTFEFAYSPIDFIRNKTKEHCSPVFKVRVLNKPTIFLTSSNAVKELLEDNYQCFEMGYKDLGYMHSLFGDLVLFFNEDDSVSRLRGLIHSLFIPQTVETITDVVNRSCNNHFPGFQQATSIAVYDHFKQLTTQMCLSMFLGLDCKTSMEETQKIAALTVTHWHGLISVPISLKIGNFASSYGLAMEAQKHLLEVIKQRLPQSKDCLLSTMNDVGFRDIEELSRHMLLFVSALVPKALSSLLTSCCLELAKPHNAARRLRATTDDEYLDKVLLEVKRLWPPFLGGRRIAKKSVVLDGFHIPKGYSVAYLTRSANIDPSVFKNPEKFLPERWEEIDAQQKRSRVFTFGFGPRNCIGEHCIGRILHIIMKRLLAEYGWELDNDQDLTYKWLPVSRPKHDVMAKFWSKAAL
ncbi:uncharacterized protein LOC114516204 [Dendronephthya gigantea]|uniref:uncharacterized protein LOC114516204 n=1 Tax=Dendronephthya gigantea TaxID=151771 RepID=UPI00106D3CD3|nr:uncharacterized protein LOC114516204 [Dendronephthya gigantea]XP_028391413.1 uncharacterized protein LOC114516204 [Dendronephthya gigantea]XP_028391414.1 uncharacterized protein LOC114516204 [Dendronephthya gigantea]XP_028391415.1 uncharacterized protein LOC114516204 [Dendronephthya gigantea]XP_028391416.1 uncharacterized protein LOC114516204 [Dendronephthya gigantea]